MIQCIIQPSAGKVDASFQKIPFGISVVCRNPVKQFFRLNQAIGLNHAANICHTTTAAGLTIIALRISLRALRLPIACILIGSLLCRLPVSGVYSAGVHDLVKSLIQLLHFLVGNICKRTVRIIVRVILFGKLPGMRFLFPRPMPIR